jgi:hypothetical protein
METRNQASVFARQYLFRETILVWDVLAQFPRDALIFPAAHGHGVTSIESR